MTSKRRKLIRNIEARVIPVTIFVFIIAAVFSSIFVMQPFNESAGATFNKSEWDYYKRFTVTNKYEGYQTMIVVGNSTGGDTNCSGHANGNFSDLRFACANDTLVPYWIENYTADTQANVWIKNSYNDTYLYMYYGNSDAASASNGTNTFIFFDDAESGSVADNWNYTYTGSCYAQYSTELNYTGSRSIKVNDVGSDSVSIKSNQSTPPGLLGVRCGFKFNYASGDNGDTWYIHMRGSPDTDYYCITYWDGDETIRWNDGSDHEIGGDTGADFTYQAWNRVEYCISEEGATDFAQLSVLGYGTWSNIFNSDDSPSSFDGILFSTSGADAGYYGYIDDFYTALWIHGTEPSFSFDEETENAGVTCEVTGLDGNNRITFGSGDAGNSLWSNATGNWSNGAMLNFTINTSANANVTDICIYIGDIDAGANVYWENISIDVALDNSTFPNDPYSFGLDEGDNNISLNASWDTDWGTNPFPISNVSQGIDCYILIRFLLDLDSTAIPGVYAIDTWSIKVKIISW